MDIEALRLILEMLGNAGEGTQDMFVVYVVAGIIPNILGAVIFLVVAIMAARILHKMVDNSREHSDASHTLARLNVVLFPENTGSHGYVYDSQIQAMIEEIHRLQIDHS